MKFNKVILFWRGFALNRTAVALMKVPLGEFLVLSSFLGLPVGGRRTRRKNATVRLTERDGKFPFAFDTAPQLSPHKLQLFHFFHFMFYGFHMIHVKHVIAFRSNNWKKCTLYDTKSA